MPAAILIAGLVAIAFAFAAISADLLLRNLVISPIDAAAAAASEVAVVGGVLSWMLTQLANFVRFSLDGVRLLVSGAETQAADWWNYLVGQTVSAQFSYWWQQLAWLTAQEGAIAWLESHMPSLWSFVVDSVWPTMLSMGAALNSLTQYVHSSLAPWVGSIQGDLNYVRSIVTGYLVPRVGGIGDDLAGLHRWIDANVVQHGELARAQDATIARVMAIAAPITAAITEIENSPCMKACGPLGDLGAFIQGLEDASLLAVFMALIQQARTDPVGLEREISSTVVPAMRDVASSLGLGIPE